VLEKSDRQFDEQMEQIPELSGFENLRMNTSTESHRSLFKRSMGMREDLDHPMIYKRQRLEDQQSQLSLNKVEEQLDNQ